MRLRHRHGRRWSTPTLELEAVRAVPRTSRSARRHAARSTTAAGAGRPARDRPVHLRRARPRRGGRPGRAATRTRWWRTLTERPLTVAVVGFSPGLRLPRRACPTPLRAVPRRDRPRPVVPAGSVALANGHAAVYPTASPGGWQLVGRTGFPLFSPDRPPYAVLAPGDRVQLTAAGRRRPARPGTGAAPALGAAGRRPRRLRGRGARAARRRAGRRSAGRGRGRGPARPPGRSGVVRPGQPPRRQRRRRRARSSSPAAGHGCAVVAACHVAVVGAAPEVRLDGAAVPAGQVLPLAAGPGARGGAAAAGLPHLSGGRGRAPRARGVRRAAPATSSAGWAPGRSRPGSSSRAGPWAPPLGDHLGAGRGERGGGRCPWSSVSCPGPHPEWFEPDALSSGWPTTVFRVEADSNRVGIRLRARGSGAAACDRTRARPASSTRRAWSPARCRCRPDGDPVILMPDHATLGGYPVLAVVASADHGRARSVRAGHSGPPRPDRASTRRTRRWRASRAAPWRRAVVGHYPLAVTDRACRRLRRAA